MMPPSRPPHARTPVPAAAPALRRQGAIIYYKVARAGAPAVIIACT